MEKIKVGDIIMCDRYNINPWRHENNMLVDREILEPYRVTKISKCHRIGDRYDENVQEIYDSNFEFSFSVVCLESVRDVEMVKINVHRPYNIPAYLLRKYLNNVN